MLELQLKFSSEQDDACTLSTTPPIGGHRAIDRKITGFSSRISTSLLMIQNSDSTEGGGFGNDDFNKKRREPGNDTPKPKANKRINNDESVGRSSGVVKGSSDPSNENGGENANDGSKRTRVKGEKGKNKKQQNKKGEAKGRVNEASVLDTGKSTIRSSDENTSLKGFKSEKIPNHPPPPPPRQNQGGSNEVKNNEHDKVEIGKDNDLKKRVVQLETIVSNQMTEIQRLRREVDDLTRDGKVFSKALDLLRKAGLQIEEEDAVVIDDDEDDDRARTKPSQPLTKQTFHYDMEIFGIAPKSVTDAADTAGASMLSAILAGKHRMLVDVRDAELTRDPKLLVEFIELAILPVAAGLEGLDSVRNRVKIVFPTVKELMSYRKSMALAAPEVVSLSTLGFEPVDERDNLIVVIAPSPDDASGVAAMEKLIARTDKNYVEPERRILQPVVVMNHHMVPVDMAGFGKFTTVYHLRLLSVQYMTGDSEPEFVNKEEHDDDESTDDSESVEEGDLTKKQLPYSKFVTDKSEEDDEALEAAMTHAHEIGFHQGVTRAMVIRAYPK